MKIVTIGAGFVSEHLNYPVVPERLEFDMQKIDRLLDTHRPDVVVNCVGKTGRPNIDWCETHREETALANTVLPIMLADACDRKSIHLIQIGSGCIFFGPSPRVERAGYQQKVFYDHGWLETDFANPQSYYSKTKYASDLAVGNMRNVTLLRIRMPISTKNNQRNLINKLRSYQHIIDIPNSVTFMDDFAKVVHKMATDNITGTFHVTNPGSLSAAQIMREYQKYVPDHVFDVITEEGLKDYTLAKRSNCILNTEKLNSKFGIYLPEAKDALVSCMQEYVKSL